MDEAEGEFINTDFGRVFIPRALGETGPTADVGTMLSFSEGGVVVTFIGHRLEADQIGAEKPDLEALSRVWLPRENFEAATAGFQACIDDWRRHEEGGAS